LRIGFLPENDCASVVAAQEFGFFADQGLNVQLSRESSCAWLRDKLISGELDAAHAPATLPFVLSLGLDFEQCPCVSGMVLSLQGNAITISRTLWKQGVKDAEALRNRVCRDWGKRTYTLGVVFPYAPSYFLLCDWMRSAAIIPHSHVRIVVVPPEQMFPMLELGYLDGFCAGEPWTSVAEAADAGVCLATSAQLAPLHPEKVLIVRREFAERRADVHRKMITALLEASRHCDDIGNCEGLCEILAQPQFVNAPVECLRPGLIGPFVSRGGKRESLFGLNVLRQYQANDPCSEKAAWITGRLCAFLKPGGHEKFPAPRYADIYRPDIFRMAERRVRKGKEPAEKLPLTVLAEPRCLTA
jgi:ABC-type nitrate/sulfonate/bicarbonate transport system substrate-binding protein